MEEIKFLRKPSEMKKEDTNGKTGINANAENLIWRS